MKIQRADSLKTSHDLLVQWQNQQNKRKRSNVDGLFIESFLCFLVSLDRVTDIKTKTSFCNTSNRDYVHNSSLSGGCSSVFSSVSIPILFSSWAFCSEADCVSSESHDVTKERALLMAPPAIEKEKIYDHGRSGFYLKHFILANHNTLLLSNGPIFYRTRRKINVAADEDEKNVCYHVTNGLTSDWLRSWREFF